MEPEKEIQTKQTINTSPKKKITFAILGPFQSGKSTIAGKLYFKHYKQQVFQLEELLDKAEVNGFDLTKVPFDKSLLEMKRGISVESQQMNYETDTNIVNIIDIPGKINLMKNIIRGLCLIEYGVFVLSSEFNERNQEEIKELKELLLVAYTTGIRRLVVAVNKMERCEFSQRKFENIKNFLSPILLKIGFKENLIDFIPISALKEDNFFIKSSLTPWYEGETLSQLIESFENPKKIGSGDKLRIIVTDFFNKDSYGTIILGRVASGKVAKLDTIHHSKCSTINKKIIVIKKIESLYREIEEVVSDDGGREYAFNLEGINVKDLKRGDVFNNDWTHCNIVKSFTAKLKILTDGEFKVGYSPSLYVHSANTPCRIDKIIKTEKEGVQSKSKKGIKGAIIIAEITPKEEINLDVFESMNSLGKIILRDGITVAVGKVESIKYKDCL